MSIIPTDPSIDELADSAIKNARELIDEAERLRDHSENANRRRFSRLFRDPRALEVTITLTDEVMRIDSVTSSMNIFRRAAAQASVEGFGLLNAAGLKFLAASSRLAPTSVIKAVARQIRHLSRDLILPYEKAPLQRHLERRRRDDIALNINVLGEAVLGEHEAEERLERVLEIIRRPEINYISVKLSSVVSQIITIDRVGSLDRVATKMRRLYREAESHGTFVNLDMEEYRDLDLTMTAFKKVLTEREFAEIAAGIVLQAYLPESHAAFADLVEWSKLRHATSGGIIKVRLVKGANLAMETTEAELHGWPAGPYRTKADVDASYARLIDAALRPEHAHAVRVGIASHNLFHLSWALAVARVRGVEEQVDVEMLEGMANSESLAIAKTGRRVLLYAPVTQRDDFASAVAYLVRRLDENTSDENYLKAAFDIATDEQRFEEQRDRFTTSVHERHALSTASLRHAPIATSDPLDFSNVVNFDPTSSKSFDEITSAFAKVREIPDRQIPLVIAGREIMSNEFMVGLDPSADAEPWYRYSVADAEQVDEAVRCATIARESWSELSIEERRRILYACAKVMEDERITSTAVMARDGGKTEAEAEPEVSEGIDFARFYASSASDFEDSSPLGTILVVPPWNFPYAIPAGGVCAALAAGNAVILKPAPETVATAWELVQQLWAGGVPRDVLQFVPTRDDDNGRRLVTHEGVNAVILTGAFDTALMFTTWRPDITLLAETSGKNAIVISACADIDVAVKDLVQSAFGHAGQKCSAASLAIVVRDVYEDPAFLRQLSDAVRSLRVGPSWELSTSVGPIIRSPEAPLERALHHLDPGESWLLQPHPLDAAGLQWSPGVKLGVRSGSWSHQHEWFGPVLGIMVAPDFATAIRWQNRTDFGLTAGLQSLDEQECELWMDRVEAGNLYVNRGTTGAIVNRQPFGGWRRSSVGPTAKAGGHHYVQTLRRWAPLTNVESSLALARAWWRSTGSQAIDRTGLHVEKNFHRYRHYAKTICVRVDDGFDESQRLFIDMIVREAGVHVTYSALEPVGNATEAVIESSEALASRADSMGRVRWLSSEDPPVVALLEHGVTLDRRALIQRGDVEMARWLREQSVAITHHRYGNVNAGPKPNCEGLGSSVLEG
ncbi:MAG TPA: bifunctional proline dehydrogenase/L-glutamate gamma-semialdehyde dehydrogenase [Acidimicrobiales bacterium]|nr:bifunctional proline dehydrogenase/L-glutamate gamma-semialdehyde dehydrogenase [Acidimicrobiales bacterium]